MGGAFYADGLEARGIRVVLPISAEQDAIHAILRRADRRASHRGGGRGARSYRIGPGGAEAVLLACTELELLTRTGRIAVPIVDGARVHAQAAWEEAVKHAGHQRP